MEMLARSRPVYESVRIACHTDRHTLSHSKRGPSFIFCII
uniref:Uncharacterized protein n=1 Tax=Anguilla anguilla TaxID=7936 RepID=A0A0E9U4U7_ANGAN